MNVEFESMSGVFQKYHLKDQGLILHRFWGLTLVNLMTTHSISTSRSLRAGMLNACGTSTDIARCARVIP